MKISVLGCGRWGSFIGWYLARRKHEVTQWGIAGDYSFEVLKNEGKNEYVDLDKTIELTGDLEHALSNDLIIISISSQALRSFMGRVSKFDLTNKKFVLCMKGIEETTGKRLSEVLMDFGVDKNNIAVWVGPGHIQEFVANKPNCMVIDSYNKDLKSALIEIFSSDLIRFYYGDDIIGSEIGAATKNIMGIAAGMLDGSGRKSLKGALMARGAREVARLIESLGGSPFSAYGLCHLGDYETTLFSEFSNNRRFGEDYVNGVKFKKLAEGVSTSKAIKLLAEKQGVEMPITNAIYNIVYLNMDANEQLAELFLRTQKQEF